jgi:hypothetical protein
MSRVIPSKPKLTSFGFATFLAAFTAMFLVYKLLTGDFTN